MQSTITKYAFFLLDVDTPPPPAPVHVMFCLTICMTLCSLQVIYGCDLATLNKKLEMGNLPAKEVEKVNRVTCVFLTVVGFSWGKKTFFAIEGG